MAISIDAPLRDAPARTGPARRRLGARLADRSVGGKLSLGFAAVSIVVLIVVCALLVAVARLSSANRNLAVVAATRVGAADEVAAAAGGLRNAQSIYLLDGGASRASFESKAHEFEQALDGPGWCSAPCWHCCSCRGRGMGSGAPDAVTG